MSIELAHFCAYKIRINLEIFGSMFKDRFYLIRILMKKKRKLQRTAYSSKKFDKLLEVSAIHEFFFIKNSPEECF